MTNVLLDARTINAVLEALNNPISNATEACARVRILARAGGLEIADDRELAGGDFSPFLKREALLDRAVQAASDYSDWCNENESMFTGWGDGEVPTGATQWRKDADAALALLKGAV